MNAPEPFDEARLRAEIKRAAPPEDVPADVQERLEATYSALASEPQERARRLPLRHSTAIALAACLATTLVAGAGFAVSNLIAVQQGEAPFFDGNNLPVYDSLKPVTESFTAEVGDSVQAGDYTITLDSVSCDRNVINLFVTMEREGGIEPLLTSTYEGSQEGDWFKLRRIEPILFLNLESDGEWLERIFLTSCDRYLEDGKVRFMYHVVPTATLPNHVTLTLDDGIIPLRDEPAELSPEGDGVSSTPHEDIPALSVGLDLSTVPLPREVGPQTLTFSTSEGEKQIELLRFTASELGTVMVTSTELVAPDEGTAYNPAEGQISPDTLMLSDDEGNVIPNIGNVGSFDPSEDIRKLEFAKLDPDVSSLTLTPMTGELGKSEERSFEGSIPDQQLPTSEHGGYTLVDRTVEGSTVVTRLKPYGWASLPPDIQYTAEGVSWLDDYWVDEATGETYGGRHMATQAYRWDYVTGDLLDLTSYYAATAEELEQATAGTYRYSDNVVKECDAAVSISFK